MLVWSAGLKPGCSLYVIRKQRWGVCFIGREVVAIESAELVLVALVSAWQVRKSVCDGTEEAGDVDWTARAESVSVGRNVRLRLVLLALEHSRLSASMFAKASASASASLIDGLEQKRRRESLGVSSSPVTIASGQGVRAAQTSVLSLRDLTCVCEACAHARARARAHHLPRRCCPRAFAPLRVTHASPAVQPDESSS